MPNKLLSVVGLGSLYDASITWLKFGSGVRGQEHQLHVGVGDMGGAGQLSTNIRIFLLWILIWLLTEDNHWAKRSLVIHALRLLCHCTGSRALSYPRMHLGLALLPMTRGFSFSPAAEQASKTVILSLLSFLPLQGSQAMVRGGGGVGTYPWRGPTSWQGIAGAWLDRRDLSRLR